MEQKIDKKEIKRLIEIDGMEITDVIDVVIEVNGIIGVGLISLGEDLKQYCYDKIVPREIS